VRDRLADLGAGARAHERPRVDDLLDQQANVSEGPLTTEAPAAPEEPSTPTTGEDTPSPSTTAGRSHPSTSEPGSVPTAPTSSPSTAQSDAGQ
jgi:hypothetical protein